MGELGLKSCIRVKKYRAYHGQVGPAFMVDAMELENLEARSCATSLEN